MKRPVGTVRLKLFRHGKLIWTFEENNLFVNTGLPALASLLGGDTTGQFASAIGFGSNGTAPALTDSALTAPAYYKALDGHSEDGQGSVTFTWSLGSSDSGAVGMTIQELGLLANQSSVTLPGTTAPAPLLARKTISAISFTSGMNLSGSWTLSF